MSNKVYMVFVLPFVVNFFRSVYGNEQLDLTLLVVAAVSCIYGSTMRVTWKNLNRKKANKPMIYWIEVFAIYIFGIGFGFASYFVGLRYSVLVALIVGGIGSFLSIDILSYLIQMAPRLLNALFEKGTGTKLNDKDNERNP